MCPEAVPLRIPYQIFGPPELLAAVFRRDPARAEELTGELSPTLQFELNVVRTSVERVGVALAVKLLDVPGVKELAVAYHIVLDVPTTEGRDHEQELHFVVSQVAPFIVYPFIRETMHSTLVKSGLPPLVPPIVDWHCVFDPKAVVVPPAPADSENHTATASKDARGE